MARKRRARRNRRGDNGFSYSKLGIFIILIILASVFIFIDWNQPPELEPTTFCPREEEISKNTYALLLDTTEEISATQKREIINFVDKIVKEAAEYDRFVIYQVDPSQNELLSSDFDYCKPANEMLDNPIMQMFRGTIFKNMLRKKLSPLFGRKSSPIIKAIGSVETQFPTNGSKRHLIVASDLIENSEILSQFNPGWKIQANQNKKVLIDTQPNLENIELTILWIPRPGIQHHNTDFILWWGNYFKNAKANIKEVIKITG